MGIFWWLKEKYYLDSNILTPLPIRTARSGWVFLFMDMAKIAYLKQIKPFDDQISILKSRGMVIKDEARAKQILQNISYYRLSGYWYPLLADKQHHLFKSRQERKEGTCLWPEPSTVVCVCPSRFKVWHPSSSYSDQSHWPWWQFDDKPFYR